jgi:hypothetical protein
MDKIYKKFDIYLQAFILIIDFATKIQINFEF